MFAINDKIKKVFVVYNSKQFTIVKLPFPILKILDYTLVLESSNTKTVRNLKILFYSRFFFAVLRICIATAERRQLQIFEEKQYSFINIG